MISIDSLWSLYLHSHEVALIYCAKYFCGEFILFVSNILPNRWQYRAASQGIETTSCFCSKLVATL